MIRKPRLLLIGAIAGFIFASGFAAGIFAYHPLFRWYLSRAERRTTAQFLGKSAPDVQAATLDGTAWRLSDQRGKVVLIDFWATWCAPCTGALPILKSAQKRFGARGDFELVGVSLDDEKKAVEKYIKDYEISWPILFEPGAGWQNKFARRFRVRGIPSLWVVDKSGAVSAMNVWDQEVLDEVVRALGERQEPEPSGKSPG